MPSEPEASTPDWAGPRPLRLATAISFLPALPLCLIHSAKSSDIYPVVGLLPLAVSSLVGLFLARPAAHIGASRRFYPIVIFVGDIVLASALISVLSLTWAMAPGWMSVPFNREYAMLAGYATMPLLVNFLIHLYLALRAIYIGLALDGLTQWAAWQAVPPECPNCHHHLRPAMPKLPWFDRDREGYSSLFVNPEGGYRDEETETEREPVRSPEPAAVEVIGKKGKGRASTGASGAEESTAWP